MRLCVCFWLAQAAASTIELENSSGLERDGQLSVDARFIVNLDAVHESALLSGIPLTFAVEFTLTEPRWYWAWRRVTDWFDSSARLDFKLSYHSLTRTYRVGVGTLYQSYDTLNSALRGLGVVREWHIAERGSVTRRFDSRFAGELTMRLDQDSLPKPLQLSLIGDADWRLETEPTRIEFHEAR
ncbi:DUF4390 domain-containing protein [Chitinimonas sp. BJB300]|uniref:DUF4390 domain-containing protein n=1 Tax=Chitinimonas sp. BJB300 TaxID=1559339 RepID=UPI00130447D3|nr:DUF4390 domain-containing protein [Chitinimonas sp. BJB300]